MKVNCKCKMLNLPCQQGSATEACQETLNDLTLANPLFALRSLNYSTLSPCRRFLTTQVMDFVWHIQNVLFVAFTDDNKRFPFLKQTTYIPVFSSKEGPRYLFVFSLHTNEDNPKYSLFGFKQNTTIIYNNELKNIKQYCNFV